MRKRMTAGTALVMAFVWILTVVSVLGSGGAAAQTITQIIDATGDGAGNGLNSPFAIAVDAAGNVHVTGFGTNNAFKITPAGAITEIIDSFGDGAGNVFSLPTGIAVDAAGNAYVMVNNSDNAFKITPAGVITEIIDAAGDGAGNVLDGPYGIAVDAAGNAYVAGDGSDNALKITPAGVITEIIDATGDGAGNGLNGTVGIAVDTAGNVYMTGEFSDNVFKTTPAGVITEIIDMTGDGAGNGLGGPFGIAVDGAGNAYVTGFSTNNAFKITPAGVITEIIDVTGDGANGLNQPTGIAVDGAGNVYVTGFGTSNAFKITPAGVITEIIDAAGDGAGHSLIFPFGIALDGAGNVYVTGAGSDNAFKITLAGPPPIETRTLTIKDHHCPGPLNSHSHGALRVVLVAEPDFDVTQIVLTSLELRRADGVGSVAFPNLGPSGPQPQFKDEKHPPFGAGPCACDADFAKDGLADLRLPFRQDEMTAALLLNTELQGAAFELELTGELIDGRRFIASDCVVLTQPPAAAGRINVQSNEADVWVDASPLDRLFDDGGFANFERNYLQGAVVTLTAPRFAGGRLFTGWLIDGAASGVAGVRSIGLTVSGNHSVLATYADLALGDVNRDGTVDGGDIQGFINVLVAPAGAGELDRILADLNGDNQVDLVDTTQFVQMLLGPA